MTRPLLPSDAPLALADWPAWTVVTLPWFGALLLVAAAACVALLWLLLGRLRRLERHADQLEHLAALRAGVERLAGDERDLDLRRIEHVLIDMRDGQKRLEDALLRQASLPVQRLAAGGGLAERVQNRLLALGYERIQIVTSAEELQRVERDDGAVVVEARRGGVACKGRVRIERGALVDVDLQSAYSTFP